MTNTIVLIPSIHNSHTSLQKIPLPFTNVPGKKIKIFFKRHLTHLGGNIPLHVDEAMYGFMIGDVSKAHTKVSNPIGERTKLELAVDLRQKREEKHEKYAEFGQSLGETEFQATAHERRHGVQTQLSNR